MLKIDAAHVDDVIQKLARKGRIDNRVANRIVRLEMTQARIRLARMAGKVTGLSIAQAKRRIVTTGLRKRRKSSWKYAGIRTYRSAVDVHAGRLRLSIRDGVIVAGGRHTYTNAFLWNPRGKPGYLKGKKRRVYFRTGSGREIQSANLPKQADMEAVYKVAGNLVAQSVSNRLRHRIVTEAVKF